MVAKVSIKRASEILGISQLTVQCALRAGALPIGAAWKNEGSTCYTYHISPKLLSDYTGIPVEEIVQEVS